ncbi:MAG: hypothetical protein NDI81_16235 [Desulfobacula sp.]|jgi:hypothetical protein|nr:hypothetical protein [Desulfobacula sp.]MDA8135180.1 hypothetical protein [Desulfobacteraceae bacterium]
MKPHKDKKELMELKHDAVPGYRGVFSVVFTLSLLYMAFILFQPCF